MKIAALSNKDAWFSRLVEEMGKHRLDGQVLRAVPTEDTVVVDTATLEHDGPNICYRPYIALTGRILSSRPAVELPYGVDELTFASHPGTPVAYRYNLSDEQIARLVLDKGLHSGSFALPEELVGIEWELPGTIDAFVAAPTSFNDPPVVFVELHDQTQHLIDVESSGYELVDYTPDFQLGEQTAEVSYDAPTRASLGRDLFADEGVSDYGQEVAAASRENVELQSEPADEQQEGASAFDRLLQDASARVQARAEEEKAAEEARRAAIKAEINPDGPENVYQSRILPAIDAALVEESGLEDQTPEEQSRGRFRRVERERTAREAQQETQQEVVEQATSAEGFMSFD